MAQENRYTPPRAAVADVYADEETQPIRLWSATGRLGRLRYFAYPMGAWLVVGAAVGLGRVLLGPVVAGALAVIGYVAAAVFAVLTTIKRSHDMDWSGWTCLIAIFVPFAALIWLFKGGTPESNRYGAPPPPNTLGVKLLAWLLPIALIGIIAAVGIPAYQQYVHRTQSMQSQP